MNLINQTDKDKYSSSIDDIHDTFAREIIVIKEIKTPIDNLDDADDDYDFINDKHRGSEEFENTIVTTTIKARIKYIDKQDKEYAFISTLGGEQINLSQEFGLIRLKIKLSESDLVNEASRIEVDKNNTRVIFRDSPHGLFDRQYSTFYVQRTP